MSLIKKIRNSNFWIRLNNWEYWPFELVYIPVMFYWVWLSFKARSPFFFSASNPGIEYGGMLGESKIKILDKIPPELKPVSIYVPLPVDFEKVKELMQKYDLQYPLIFKPDIGERGWMVEKINNDEDIRDYMEKIEVNFLIQDYVDLPIELGVMYYRYPDRESGKVSSIVIKKMLEITGDGTSTVEELIKGYPRAKLQLSTLKKEKNEIMNQVLPEGDSLELVPYGNHCRGAAFFDGNHLINDQLNKTFDRISSYVDGFYYGRFDCKCRSWEDLYKGNIKIMELNGAGAEPAHIYDPETSIFKAYSCLFEHMRELLKVSKINKNNGVNYMNLKDGWYVFKQLPIFKKFKFFS